MSPDSDTAWHEHFVSVNVRLRMLKSLVHAYTYTHTYSYLSAVYAERGRAPGMWVMKTRAVLHVPTAVCLDQHELTNLQ